MSAQPSDINTIKSLPANRKTALGIFLLILFVLGTGLGVMVARNRDAKKDTTMNAAAPAPAESTKTELALNPSTATLKVGEVLPVSVKISKEAVQAVDVVVTYDPAVFSAGNIQTGDFPKILRQKITPGRIVVSTSVSPDNPTPMTDGIVFTFSLTALSKSTATTVAFDASETITAKGGANTLGTTSGSQFKVE